jgi:hypothetical protein
MTDANLDIEERVMNSLSRAGVQGPDPVPDLDDVLGRVRRRRRSLAVAAAGGLAVLLVVSATLMALSRFGDEPRPRIRSGTEAPSTTEVRPSMDRPVLDHCTPTRAIEMSAEGPPLTAPVSRFQVYADPARGVHGPLAAVTYNPTPGGTSSTDGNTGGLRANSEIDGRDLTLQPEIPGNFASRGYAQWDTADGGNAILFARGVNADDLRALVEALDRNSGTLPAGLVSIGIAGHVESARSDCYNNGELVAWITTFRGDAPSRWVQVFAAIGSPGGTILDDGATTTVIVGFPGRYDSSDTAYHQATPEEWAKLIAANSQPPFAPPR